MSKNKRTDFDSEPPKTKQKSSISGSDVVAKAVNSNSATLYEKLKEENKYLLKRNDYLQRRIMRMKNK